MTSTTVSLMLRQGWEALGWALAHSLWQGAAIALAVTVLFIFIPRTASPWRYGIALSALSLMSVAFFATLAYEWQRIGGLSASTWPAPPAGAPAPDALQTLKLYMARHIGWLSVVWMAGSIAFGFRWAGGMWWLARLRRDSRAKAPEYIVKRLHHLAARMDLRQAVELMVSASAKTPMVLGHLRPVVLLPACLLTGLSPAQLDAILAHELAHVRRADYLINLILSALEMVFFFHPAYWWLMGQIRDEREHCCDDLAIRVCGGDVVGYAQALAATESLRMESLRMAPGLLGRQNHLLDRIKRLIHPAAARPALQPGSFAGMAAALGLCAMIWFAPAGKLAASPIAAVCEAIEAAMPGNVLPPDRTVIAAKAPSWIAAVDSPPPPPPLPPPAVPVTPMPPIPPMPPMPPMPAYPGAQDPAAAANYQRDIDKWRREYEKQQASWAAQCAEQVAVWESQAGQQTGSKAPRAISCDEPRSMTLRAGENKLRQQEAELLRAEAMLAADMAKLEAEVHREQAMRHSEELKRNLAHLQAEQARNLEQQSREQERLQHDMHRSAMEMERAAREMERAAQAGARQEISIEEDGKNRHILITPGGVWVDGKQVSEDEAKKYRRRLQ